MKNKFILLTGVTLLGLSLASSVNAASINTNLIHNSYVYSGSGKRLNKKTLKKNSIIKVLDTKTIKNKKYVKIAKDQYIKATNVAMPIKRTLTHNAYIYNDKGKRVKKVVLKKNSKVTTFETVTINKKKFYRIGKDQYVKVGNFKPTKVLSSDNKIEKTLKQTAALYDEEGNVINGDYVQEGTTLEIKGTKIIDGERYYQTAGGYIKAAMFEDEGVDSTKLSTSVNFEKLSNTISSTSLTTTQLQEKYHKADEKVRRDYDEAVATAKKVLADKNASTQDLTIANTDLQVAFNAINGEQ
ncbi:hypothetical protein FP435_04130 [Lactobacillus sp. PV037]|uniref:SLAP domain-containing protein n=1 Tax=Lactobacillus sp. PV037 TaxID=2594496 RepID=UPI00223ECD11|nr:SLAP domain-containing protein [Lactobacillus sp. PV037]QNQ83687.1 hypothetical protein FP435_04130 [Lactobacillus sp. PV037]